jgi:hypothetical protein
MLLLDRMVALAQVASMAKPYAKPHRHGNTNRLLALSVMLRGRSAAYPHVANRRVHNFV